MFSEEGTRPQWQIDVIVGERPNPKSYALPGAPALRVASALQLEKL